MENNEHKKVAFVLIIIGLVLLGFAGYKLFVEKKPEGGSNPPEEKQILGDDIVEEYLELYNVKEKTTYRSKDGSKEIVVEPSGETYYAHVDGKKIEISFNKLGKYILVSGDEIDKHSECGDYTYIIDSENNTIIDLYTDKTLYIIKLNNNYLFTEGYCSGVNTAVYDDNLNIMGTSYVGHDKKNYYILNGNIIKYDASGKEVARTSESFDMESNNDAHLMMQEADGVLYILIKDKTNVYFIDTRDLKTTVIDSSSEYSFGGLESNSMVVENGKIVLHLQGTNGVVNMSYDINSRKLTK